MVEIKNLEKTASLIREEIKDITNKNIIGLYIRTNQRNKNDIQRDIQNQLIDLNQYCDENNLANRILYVDIRRSGLDKNRKAFKEMLYDAKTGKINTILVTEISKLSRDIKDIYEILLTSELIILNETEEDGKGFRKICDFIKDETIEEF